MLEAVLVLTEGCFDLKEKPEGGELELPIGSRWGCPLSPTIVRYWSSAAAAHRRVGVQLHVGAPAWSADYELSKNLHRLASSRAVRLVPICIAAPHLGQFQLAVEVTAASGHTCRGCGVIASSWRERAKLAVRWRVARKPYCRMRTKPRGRICWENRHRNSVALKVILRCLPPWA